MFSGKLCGEIRCGYRNYRLNVQDILTYIDSENLTGLCIGLCTFLVIGLFHPIVIKAEYHWGVRSWWIFLVAGLAAALGSVIVDTMFVSVLLGVVSFSSFWSILEMFQQRERVRKGWFPENPKRKNR